MLNFEISDFDYLLEQIKKYKFNIDNGKIINDENGSFVSIRGPDNVMMSFYKLKEDPNDN